MNIQQLRESLKMKWLSYYQQNRLWLVKMRIWGTYDDLRRPSSGFMLATLSVLEPQFDQILAFILELNNNPDQIITALGLNFNPDEELDSIIGEDSIAADQFTSDFLEEIHDQVQPVPLVTDSPEVISSSPTRILNSEQQLCDLTPIKIPVSSFTVTNEIVRDRQPESSVAVATQVSRESSAKTLLLEKPPSGILRQHQPERSLAMTREFTSSSQTLQVSTMPTKVPRNDKMLQSVGVAIKVPSNGKPLKMQLPNVPTKIKMSPSSNASSLPSWIDEFCQGADWNPEEAIFIHF